VKCYIWSTALNGAKILNTSENGSEIFDRFEMRFWRTMEKISWTKSVRNEETLHTGKQERNILTTTVRRKADWTGHILRRNCLLKPLL